MLTEEEVSRPTDKNGPTYIWRMWFPEYFYRTFLKELPIAKFVDVIALYVTEAQSQAEITIWTVMDDSATSKSFSVYAASTDQAVLSELGKRLAFGLNPDGQEMVGDLAPNAAPILKWKEGSILVRLWTTDDPSIPRRKRVRVEWGVVVYENRLLRMV